MAGSNSNRDNIQMANPKRNLKWNFLEHMNYTHATLTEDSELGNSHKQNFVCWPSVGPQDIPHKHEHKKTYASAATPVCVFCPSRTTPNAPRPTTRPRLYLPTRFSLDAVTSTNKHRFVRAGPGTAPDEGPSGVLQLPCLLLELA